MNRVMKRVMRLLIVFAIGVVAVIIPYLIGNWVVRTFSIDWVVGLLLGLAGLVASGFALYVLYVVSCGIRGLIRWVWFGD